MKNRIAAWLVNELSSADRAVLERHFLALNSGDRRLRFGVPVSDGTVRGYVKRIDFNRDAVFGAYDDDLQLLAAAHLARSDPHAELGASVLPARRNRGLGYALLERAALRARNWGVRVLFMHCLKENAAMMHLARKQGMQIVTEAGEADARIELLPADAASLFGEALASNLAIFDAALRRQRARSRALFRVPQRSARV